MKRKRTATILFVGFSVLVSGLCAGDAAAGDLDKLVKTLLKQSADSEALPEEVFRNQYMGQASDGNEYTFRLTNGLAGVCKSPAGALVISKPNASVELTSRGLPSIRANVVLNGSSFQGTSHCTHANGRYEAGVGGTIDKCHVSLTLHRTWLSDGTTEDLRFEGGTRLAECQ